MFRSMIPWKERFPATFSRFENEMEDLFGRFMGEQGDWSLVKFSPSLNVSETDDGYNVTVELPGLKPEEVKVELRDGNLWISGEKKEEQEEKGKTFHRIERRHGEFRRVVQLPGVLNEENVKAEFANGVLVVQVPKSEEVKPRRIPVKA